MKMNPTLRRVSAELQSELIRQIHIIYPAAAVVLWNDFGWRHTRIIRRFCTTQGTWDECGEYGPSKSMMQMLEDETGIEIQISGYERSFHEFSYLDADKWDGKMPTTPQAIFIRKQQIKWLRPQIIASICLAMHRDEKWGQERIFRFFKLLDQYIVEHGEKPKTYSQELENVTGIKLSMLMRGESE